MKNKISIVVPTYKEAKNIPVLSEKIHNAMNSASLPYEIIVVDDNSNDGIIEAVEEIKNKFNISLTVRKSDKGLSSAVITGMELTTGDIITVMDADLSHPAEKIPELVDPIIKGKSEFVIGSRFVKGGSMDHFNFYRKLNAWISKMFARPFTKANDPMAGFFALPKRILVDKSKLNPLGFKIGLELIVKCAPKVVSEIPISFQERLHGESKLSLKEQFNYLIHIKRLFEYKYKTLAELIKFCLIGCTGMVIDLSSTFIAKEFIHLNFRIARAIGFCFGLTNNFLLNRRFTFQHAKNGNFHKQYLSFVIVSLLGFSVNWTFSVYLYENFPFFNRFYLLAALLGIIGGLVINFAGSKFLVFKKKKK